MIDWKKPKTLEAMKVDKDTAFRHPTIAGLRLRVAPSGRKIFQWARMFKGQALRKSLGQFPVVSIVEAQALAMELNAAIERGVNALAVAEPMSSCTPRLTVTEAWERYISDCQRRKARSWLLRDQAAKSYILPLIGTKLLADVSSDDVRNIVTQPLKGERGMRRHNAVLSITKTLFKFSMENGYDDKLLRNPAGPVKPLQYTRKPPRVLTLREMALLILAAREFDKRNTSRTGWRDVVSLLVLNGNRKSEVYEARVGEWDGAAKLWRISGDRYKTKNECVLPVGPTSAAIFDRLTAGRTDAPIAFLIASQTGVRTKQDQHIVRKLTDLMAEIEGHPIPAWSPHAIRYGFRSNIRKQKIADSELAERLIHPGSGNAMSVHYDPERIDEMREALVAWDKRIAAEIRAILRAKMRKVA